MIEGIDYKSLPNPTQDRNGYCKQYIKQYRIAVPEYAERDRVSSREYYETHKNELKAKALERYYKNYERNKQRQRENYQRKKLLEKN